MGAMETSRVFVSHTSGMAHFPEDRSFVRAALDAVTKMGMVPVEMGHFPAAGTSPAGYCRERVAGCEIYVGLIGFQYGSIVPGELVSYTELEFNAASAAELHRLVFLLEDTDGVPPGLVDDDLVPVEEFRSRLRNAELIVATFASAAELELKVFQALTALPRPAPLAVRYSLPPGTATFVGRDAEVDRITAAAGRGVVAVRGMPGVGKTALAVHAAHLLRGQFPDRQLFTDLQAHTPGQDPVPPEVALAGLLTAAGVDPRYLPGSLAARTDMWRDRMAGQRVLLVLDNAGSSAQVTPLLPGNGGCLVLVTSRRYLGDLPGAVPVELDALPPDQAQAMFRQLAPAAASGPDAEVAELARLAGYLPLAVSLLARMYDRHPSWTLADLIRETQASVLTMAAENDSVAAAFGLSYRYLPAGLQRFFRCLGLHPGTSLDAYAAAALAGVPLPVAAGHLDALHGEGLLTEVGYRRYGMHDLIRRYVSDLAATGPAAGREHAQGRLLDYYQHTAAVADARLARQTRPGPAPAAPGTAVPDLPDSTRALEWARTERANLLSCLDYAARTAQHARVVALTAGVSSLLRQDGPWAEAIARHTAAVQAARRLGDRLGEASALGDLGIARELTGDYAGAAGDLEEALAICRAIGDRQAQANALSHVGAVRRDTGDLAGATQALEEALGIYRATDDRRGQADALRELGPVRGLRADYKGQATALEEALRISRGIGDRLGQASALINLGGVRSMARDYPGATEALEEALAICRDIGHRLGQANALSTLGSVRGETGDYSGATGALEETLVIFRDIGNRLGYAGALLNLGIVRRTAGDQQGAAGLLEEALGIYRALGNRVGQAGVLNDLGAVRRATGDYPGAAALLEEALGLWRDTGDRVGEAEALNELGALHLARGDPGRAGMCHQQALELARVADSSWDEAHALAGLGRCALAAGQTAEAIASLREARDIFQRMGAADTAVAAEIDALTQG